MAHDGPDHHHHHDDHHHHHHGHAQSAVGCWVVTCSDTRTAATDEGGPLAKRLLMEAGHTFLGAELVKDDTSAILHALEHALAHGARCVIFTGGTGLTRRDVTVEALEAKFEKRVDGFGELFRALSFQQVGSAAWLSRATAGVVQGALVFVLPGSPKAVELAMTRLILPELDHAVREILR
ncbi:MAG: molybdenum cofactor biosynthesis protein B [Archangium sp.]|nr:molybdenum cofactor biosynthesis protein B [Archangium sp.]